ncbi:sialin-like isoform X2 [Nasonia vitripennis]|uniref:Major facilitator superfamily (MFS) profile domain-containing protein n=1 Tax=Nasonia vitripennis TaxID=7425 RepID=A0A7M7PXH9_NASVI|nr:sialin-like isoform X2 [Nasonia vitripennis]
MSINEVHLSEVQNFLVDNGPLPIYRTHYEVKAGATWMFWRKRRYVMALLAFWGFFVSYVLRVNLSVAIVKILANHTIVDDNGTVSYYQEFDWDSRLQGHVLSSFFYGYICTPLLGGWLAARIGGKHVFGIGIVATSFFTVLTPPVTRYSVYLLMAVRVIEGLFEVSLIESSIDFMNNPKTKFKIVLYESHKQGVTYPAINALVANWAPPLERSRLATITFAGSFVGTVVAMPVCGLMAERLGWPSLFYVFGSTGFLWYLIWCFLIRDRPEEDPWINKAELKYIRDSLRSSECERSKHISHPWRQMLLSPVVWAIITAHFSENWGFYTMITQLPTFMNGGLDFTLETAGFLSALPYLLVSLVMLVSGQLADWLQSRGTFTTTQVRKLFNCGAFVAQTIFLAATAYYMTPVIAISCITAAIALGGFSWSGFSVNYLDIAPKHASVLWGMGNTVGTLPGIISPVVTGYLVPNKTPDEWRIVFIIASVIYFVGALIYGIFTSGEEQHWAKVKDEKSNRNNQAL